MDGSRSEAVATATVMRSGRRRGIRWTNTMKEQFLDYLAATCHVTGAAEAIGVELPTIYALRRRNRVFAAQWTEALTLGYEMLETKVVGHALSGGGRTVTNGAVDGSGVDIDLALTLLTTHRNAMLGKPFKGGRQPRIATREETNAAILKKLRMVEEGIRRTAARQTERIALVKRDSAVVDGTATPANPAEMLPTPLPPGGPSIATILA